MRLTRIYGEETMQRMRFGWPVMGLFDERGTFERTNRSRPALTKKELLAQKGRLLEEIGAACRRDKENQALLMGPTTSHPNTVEPRRNQDDQNANSYESAMFVRIVMVKESRGVWRHTFGMPPVPPLFSRACPDGAKCGGGRKKTKVCYSTCQ